MAGVACVSCGLENLADAKFCGRCGARVGVSAPHPVAVVPSGPTGPMPGRVSSGQAASVAPMVGPRSAPTPSVVAAPGLHASRAPAPAPSPMPSGSLPEGSQFDVPVTRRPGWIVPALLVLDLGLLAGGVGLFLAGRAKATAAAEGMTVPGPTTPSTSGPSPATVPAGGQVGPAAVAPAAVTPAAVTPADPKQPVASAGTGSANAPSSVAPAGSAAREATPTAADPPMVAGATVDAAPSDAADVWTIAPGTAEPEEEVAQVATQIARLSTRSSTALGRCQTQASKGVSMETSVVGEVELAFQVFPSGRLGNLAVVRNTTGVDSLGACVMAVAKGWELSPAPTTVVDFARVFRFAAGGA